MTTDDGTGSSARWLSEDELETWHALNILLARLPTALGEQLQRDSGLSFIEYYVLAGLSDQPGWTMRMSHLAVFANSELSRLSHLMSRLEKRGLVRREPDPTDRRFTCAILTDSGHDLLTDAAPGHVSEVRRLIFDRLDEAAQHALRDVTEQIRLQLGVLPIGPPRTTPPPPRS
ncbi:MarR family transcriptional regulator [Aeromicrobium sp. CFBP 8757]|uniref:MarR family winged helix-turn-helix transcriptional regulator n=1 Tax=Aeromicrobium sp. CFBP 8757 TaxID=2775288 RepID=UPI00177FDBEC|nr:MarR family transcriptional regulator [Aeromicrobium sp. CFBP 8757]MBD8605412.1 MarR family transcriptional regulator [Aeromicrobium sp. CFBP 8757]